MLPARSIFSIEMFQFPEQEHDFRRKERLTGNKLKIWRAVRGIIGGLDPEAV